MPDSIYQLAAGEKAERKREREKRGELVRQVQHMPQQWWEGPGGEGGEGRVRVQVQVQVGVWQGSWKGGAGRERGG